MRSRTTNTIIKAIKVNMGGSLIDQPLPTRELSHLDPFILIHHFKGNSKPNRDRLDSGVGPHPHRGFSPVTFLYKGENVHKDSMGNEQTLTDGGTQWLFSGKGILHSERSSEAFAKNGGESEGIQLWINAPAITKMDEPFYQPLTQEDLPIVKNGNSTIRLVAGDYKSLTGPANTHSPMTLLRGIIAKGTTETIPLPPSFNTLIYLLDGELEVNGQIAKAKDMVIYKNDGDHIELKANENTRYIVLSGEPLNEPIVAQGPFVMNTEEEIMEAYRDTRQGKMGYLED